MLKGRTDPARETRGAVRWTVGGGEEEDIRPSGGSAAPAFFVPASACVPPPLPTPLFLWWTALDTTETSSMRTYQRFPRALTFLSRRM